MLTVHHFDPRCARGLVLTIVLLLLVASLGALVWRHASYAVTLLDYPYEWDDDEGLAVYFAKCLIDGRPLYVDVNRLPMVSPCYPPLYYVAVAAAIPSLGVTLAAGRFVSIVSTAIAAACLFTAVCQKTRRWTLGALAAAMYLGSTFVTIFAPFCRVDSFLIALVLGGLVLVRQGARQRWRAAAGMALLLAACYTKYYAVLIVPAALWHLWRKDRKTALAAAIAFSAAGLVILGGLQYASGGHFWKNTVAIHQGTAFEIHHLTTLTRFFLKDHSLLLVGGFGWVIYRLQRRDPDIWSVFFLGSLPIVLMTGKEGASINYYNTTIAAAAICTSLAVNELLRRLPEPILPHAALTIMLSLLLQAAIWAEDVRKPVAADRQTADRILEMIRQSKGDVLTERRYMFSVLAGRQPQVDACMLYLAYSIGRGSGAERSPTPVAARPGESVFWDPAELANAVREKRYPLLLVVPELFPPEVRTAISENYRKLQDEPVRIGAWYGRNEYILAVPR